MLVHERLQETKFAASQTQSQTSVARDANCCRLRDQGPTNPRHFARSARSDFRARDAAELFSVASDRRACASPPLRPSLCRRAARSCRSCLCSHFGGFCRRRQCRARRCRGCSSNRHPTPSRRNPRTSDPLRSRTSSTDKLKTESANQTCLDIQGSFRSTRSGRSKCGSPEAEQVTQPE